MNPLDERWSVFLPGHEPYYATRNTRRWWRKTSEPGAPGVGDLVLNTQGALCRVLELDPSRPYGFTGRVYDYGWRTSAGWVSSAVSRPTETELAAYQLTRGAP